MNTFKSRIRPQYEYTVSPEGLTVRENGNQRLIRFTQMSGFTHGIVLGKKNRPLRVKIKGERSLPLWLEQDELNTFLNDLLTHWKTADAAWAMKAVFDYSTEERNLWWIWLAVALIAVGGLGFSLLGDGLQALHCSQQLEARGQLVPAKVLKTKKNRRGTITWDMEFATLDGEMIRGKRAPVAPKGYEVPTENVGAVYVPGDIKCWDLSRYNNLIAINWAQRRFAETMAIGFGAIFSLTSIFMSLLSAYKLRRQRPHKEVVRLAGLATGLN